MSTTFTKQMLKRSRDAIASKDWSAAEQAAQDVLQHEPNNYNANVFLALALLSQERYDDSEKAYRRATTDQPTRPLAWQGLERFYTRTHKPDQLRDVLRRLMDLHNHSVDATKCAETYQRLLQLEREDGGKRSLVQALMLVLPDSEYYATLSFLDLPDQTQPEKSSTFETQMAVHVNGLDILLEIVALTEKLEADVIQSESDKRRMRLDGARKGKEALRNEVVVEVYTDSRLPALYDQILSHPSASDDLRRDTESKLLRRQLHLLRAYPSSAPRLDEPSGTAAVNPQRAAEQQASDDRLRQAKEQLRDSLVKMAEGMVIIGLDDEMAWEIVLEWSDVRSLVDLPFERLRKFVSLFPRSGRSKSFRALLLLLQDERFLAERDEQEKLHDVEIDRSRDNDLLGLAIEGIEESPSSLLGSRIAAVLYLVDRDHASASEVTTAALGLARRIEADSSVSLTEAKYGISSVLLTALTHLHSPQHHAKAIRLADSILAHEPSNVDALLARAYIDQAAARWQEARAHLQNVQQLSSSSSDDSSNRAVNERRLSISRDPGLEAWIETAWCDVHLDRLDEAKAEMEVILAKVDPLAFEGVGSEERAKIWWRLGRCMWELGGDLRTDPAHAFTCFITSLKRNPAFAPSYTSLGIYYETIASPLDAVRASKCFQKAFELDARENEAARRLAEGFADEREWDLVEVVARRTIEGEGGAEALEAGSGSASSSASIAASRRHLSQNLWAWKAIGSVEVSRKAYEKAILSFQIALRSQPDDSGSWQRLGEAYAAAGRHVAALKCFEKCLELVEQDNQRAGSVKAKAEAEGQELPQVAAAATDGSESPLPPSPNDGWQARYCISDVQRQLGNFEFSIDIFTDILRRHPSELGVRVALADTLLMSARKEFHAGYVERSEVSTRTAIRQAGRVLLEDDRHLRSAWKIVADATFHLSRFGRVEDTQRLLADDGNDEEGGKLEALLDLATEMETDAKLPSIHAVTRSSVDEGLASLLWDPTASNGVAHAQVYLRLAVYFYKLRVVLNASDSVAAGSAWSDLSVSLYRLSRCTVDEAFLAALTRQAIGSIKEALRHEPGNETFWLVLGNLTFVKSLKVSQHAYIRAVESAAKSPVPWTNLGFLYLYHGDAALANEAFVKAQTVDPDAAEAWVGQALVAQHHDDERISRILFDHAVKLSSGAVLEADYGLGSCVFTQASPPSSTALHAPSHALSTLLQHDPNNIDALHLSALFCERLGQMDIAIDRIERAAALLEYEYEREEEAETARRYAIAKVNLGRIRMAKGDAEGGREAFEDALGLLDLDSEEVQDEVDEQGEGEGGDEGKMDMKVKVDATLGLALCQYHTDDVEGGISTLSTLVSTLATLALSPSVLEDVTTSAIVYLSRLLFSSGSIDEARTRLLTAISDHPTSLKIISTLAALGLVQADADLTSAAVTELQDLHLSDVDGDGIVSQLLSYDAIQRGEEEEALDILQKEDGLEAKLELVETLVRLGKVERASEEVEWCETEVRRDLNPTEAKGSQQGWRARINRDQAIVATALSPRQQEQVVDEAVEGREAEKITLSGKKRSAKEYASLAVLTAPWEKMNWDVLQVI